MVSVVSGGVFLRFCSQFNTRNLLVLSFYHFEPWILDPVWWQCVPIKCPQILLLPPGGCRWFWWFRDFCQNLLDWHGVNTCSFRAPRYFLINVILVGALLFDSSLWFAFMTIYHYFYPLWWGCLFLGLGGSALRCDGLSPGCKWWGVVGWGELKTSK